MNALQDGPGNQFAAAFGHDAPIAQLSEDHYDRSPIATAISRVIASSPKQWSTRVGLFGRWGEGKTSVLNLLEAQQRDEGNFVIRYSPWGVSSEGEVWRSFGQALLAGLSAHGLRPGLTVRLMHWAKHHSGRISTWLRGLGKATEATGYLPGSGVAAELASNVILKHMKVTRRDVDHITANLGEKRVVIFIDDLDRTDPNVVPKLLLTVRELLDFQGFVFVLAFDKRVVDDALKEHNAAWGKTSESFLDKIIDFPFELPAPTPEQVMRLALAQFSQLCPFVPQPAVMDAAAHLPPNPRKLKLLSRMVASMRQEALRHTAGELDWPLILIFAALRCESEELAKYILQLTTDSHEVDWLKWAMLDEDARQAEQSALLDRLIQSELVAEESRARIGAMIGAWRERLPTVPGAHVHYQASFALAPHAITWGEFGEFFAAWRADKTPARIKAFLEARTTTAARHRGNPHEEFAETALRFYSITLEKASEIGSANEHLDQMSVASDTLDMLFQSVIEEGCACTLEANRLLSYWKELFNTVLKWCHFTANAREPELRQKEQETLLAFATRVQDAMELYDCVLPGREAYSFLGERATGIRKDLADAIRAQIEPRAVERALGYVEREGAIKELRSRESGRPARFLLAAPSSPLFSAATKPRLLETLALRRLTRFATADALDYLDLLLASYEHGDEICSAEERRDFILAHEDFVVTLWKLCVSSPSQFRMLQSLRVRRDKLIEAGINADLLAEPDWLKREG